MADRAWLVGAVNGVLAAGERHGGNPHWVARRSARDHVRQIGFVTPDFRRWRPGRAGIFATDIGRPRPLFADPSYADRIADRLPGFGHIIKASLLCPNNDGAGRGRFLHRHHVAAGMRRLYARQTAHADGRRQECKQNLFHGSPCNCHKTAERV